ncbi:peptidase M23 [Mycobacterium decipiens]|uniref:Peptidase M23 n=2 Tax=Mycobacterium decipiens TaxID=1430326 RepID=A0A1X2LU85_9MYCO|nr:peptidase M23 [Mycobacterium decipiens]
MVRSAVVILLVTSCATDAKSPPTSTSSTPTATSPTDTSAVAPSGPAVGPSVVTPIVGSALAPPVAVPATDGKVHLAYELKLTNTLDQEVTLTSVAAVVGGKTLLTLTGDGLAFWTRIIGSQTPTTKIGPAQTALIWLDVTVDQPADVPTEIGHMVGLTVPHPQPPLVPSTMTESIAFTKVAARKPVTIAPPLSGPGWLDGDGCCAMSAHRTALNPINGQLWGAERFAIDFVQLTPEGRLFIGDRTKVESYPYFGTDIHAVADGPVVAVVDNLPEQVPGANPSGLPLDQYGGNHVVQDIGEGNYAFYAHLATGSVRVKPGDRLTAGQVFASLGNSGNTTAPHLHFHVMSTPEPLRSNGLPYVFVSFHLDSRIASDAAVDQLADSGGPVPTQQGFAQSDKTHVMPLQLDTMSFPNG